MGRGREPWERSEAGGVIGNEQTQMKSGSPSRTTATHKTQTKTQAWSSLVFHCCHSSFNPSEAPPWDSRPVSGAGVVHYQLLHRPRSVPTALGPAPLATLSNHSFYHVQHKKQTFSRTLGQHLRAVPPTPLHSIDIFSQRYCFYFSTHCLEFISENCVQNLNASHLK